MKKRWTTIFAVAVAALAAAPVLAQEEVAEEEPGGEVQIPLALYNQLVAGSRDPKGPPRPAPASYALGSAQVRVAVARNAGGLAAEVDVELTIRVIEDEWMGIPVLPAGTPVESAAANGTPVNLIPSAEGLLWSVRRSGAYTMKLVYRVDAARSADGASLALPVPQAAAIRLSATLPGTGLDVAVIPSAGTRATESGGSTNVTATVPTTSGVQIAWRLPSDRGHALSRATYLGTLAGAAVAWTGELRVELLGDEAVTLPLLPRSVTLSQLQVDGRDTAILVEGDRFAAVVRGRGRHTVKVGFEVPVRQQDGLPYVELQVPPVPVSRFELTLPGGKEVTVEPPANVVHRARGGSTVASAHVPMTGQVRLAWSEAVPEDVRAELRTNAGIYHAVHAEEGVLLVRALIDFEVTRGETNTLEFEVPEGVQVNRITSPSGAVSDWRVSDQKATVFFDRQIRESLLVEISYDRSIAAAGSGEQIALPLLKAAGTHRQRGMVALLQSKDLTLKPVEESAATRVGENQLPPFVRQAIEMTVAHTYKYVEDPPEVKVEVSVPERQQGRFDAQVDSLVSLGDVSMKVQATVELNVKSGNIMELDLRLAQGVNLLSLTGPSVRKHVLEEVDDDTAPASGGGPQQRIAVEFTQEMEGQFRLEVTYERLLGDGESAFPVPTLVVRGAEVEQGRLAVEALSAVEVQAASAAQLTRLDLGELPQQLILRTTNPILMAYKYVQAEPPPRLDLSLTRHRVRDVEEATIDQATYTTLFTKDGLEMTTARFLVRNSGKQFLRIDLPHEDARIVSLFVDGQPEKPAESEGAGGTRVLIKIIHSTEGFPVELIYQTKGDAIGGWLGSSIRGRLPRPDEILVTHTRWDVYLPADMTYQEPRTNMEVVGSGVPATPPEVAEDLAGARGAAQVIEPLRLHVPTSGIHFAFEKLYANQSDEPAEIEIPYVSRLGSSVGLGLSLLGTALFWLGVASLAGRRRSNAGALAALILGFALVVFMVEHYHTGTGGPLGLSALALLALALYHGRGYLAGRWRGAADDEEESF